jgi:hypothetical protein
LFGYWRCLQDPRVTQPRPVVADKASLSPIVLTQIMAQPVLLMLDLRGAA